MANGVLMSTRSSGAYQYGRSNNRVAIMTACGILAAVRLCLSHRSGIAFNVARRNGSSGRILSNGGKPATTAMAYHIRATQLAWRLAAI